ncbi:MAG: sugar phosphate nucleotidyltransferase [Candidatus Shapirobacteria bacterium]|nr:sugar phosphate nucleotidyltransferase [Candidatus Shapirobacteria bacterium]
MATTPNHYFVILCGGTGPRLWPLSRANHPKQFLSLFGKKTLLEQTLDRAKKVCPSKNIFIVSNQKYKEKLEKLIKNKIPQQNFIYEPAKKNTAMAIILTLSHIYQTDPNAIITTSAADQYIKKNLKFKKTVNKAYVLAQKYPNIITIGIKATWPNPSFGYIVPQQKSSQYSNVSFFIEKPDKDTAEKLIKKNSFWNSDIHTFNINTMIEEFKKIQPEYFEFFEKLIKNPSQKEIENIYHKSPNLNINQAISEKSKNMMVIPAEFDWSDVGEWKSIYNQLEKNINGIAQLDSTTQYLEVNSKNCLISAPKDKMIGLVDVNNLAIIDTPDALLICNIAHDGSSRVREIVSQIVKKKKYKKYFLK